MIQFRPTVTRKVSPDGVHLSIYVRGQVYELEAKELARLFPAGGYEIVRETAMAPGPTENMGGEAASTAPDALLPEPTPTPAGNEPAPRASRRAKLMGRGKG